MWISTILLYSFLNLERLHAEAQSNCAICEELKTAYGELSSTINKSTFDPALLKAKGQLRLRCVSAPGQKNAIGVVQHMHIDAPLSRVLAVLDDFAGYKDLFPETEKVEASPGPEPGNFDVTWVESAPVFFMRNPVHELKYQTQTSAERKVYRSSLKSSRHLKYSEGLIVVVADGDKSTWFSEMDFYDADWSVLKVLGSEKIWMENLKQLGRSDLAVKYKAEDASVPGKEARRRAESSLDRQLLTECIQNKVAFSKAALAGPLR